MSAAKIRDLAPVCLSPPSASAGYVSGPGACCGHIWSDRRVAGSLSVSGTPEPIMDQGDETGHTKGHNGNL